MMILIHHHNVHHHHHPVGTLVVVRGIVVVVVDGMMVMVRLRLIGKVEPFVEEEVEEEEEDVLRKSLLPIGDRIPGRMIGVVVDRPHPIPGMMIMMIMTGVGTEVVQRLVLVVLAGVVVVDGVMTHLPVVVVDMNHTTIVNQKLPTADPVITIAIGVENAVVVDVDVVVVGDEVDVMEVEVVVDAAAVVVVGQRTPE